MIQEKAPVLEGAIGLGLVALLFFGCGGGNDGGKGGTTGTPGSAGTTGSAGAGAPGGGTTGGGGTGSGGVVNSGGTTGGAATGAGGTVALLGCPTSVAPTMALIADFSTSPAMINKGIAGGIISEKSADSVPAPSPMVEGGAWHVANFIAATGASEETATFGIYFSPPPSECADGHAYSGISFKIGGTVEGCTLSYLLEDSAHRKSDDMRGSCTAAKCEPARKTLTIDSTPAVVQIPWTEPSGASPNTAIDPKRLTAISWQLAIPATPAGGGTQVCMADITVDDVSFY